MVNLKDEELLAISLLVNDDLQKTFSRFTDISANRMPEEYTSAFEPEKPPVRRAPKPKPVEEQPPVVPRAKPAAKPPPAPEPEPVQKKPPPIPDSIFNLLESSEEPKKPEVGDLVLQSPLRPVNKGTGDDKGEGDADAISKLNKIMKQMELSEQEEKKRKEEETKMQTDSMFPAFQGPPMANPQMMQYMTNMASYNAMSYFQPNPYMTNMPPYAGMRPMFPPTGMPATGIAPPTQVPSLLIIPIVHQILSSQPAREAAWA